MIRTTFGRLSVTALCLVFMGSLCFGADPINIDVAPNTLNLQSEGKVVTVHTDIPFSQVTASTVLLNGVAISSWKADSRGFFVAKFVMDEIKDLECAEIDVAADAYKCLEIDEYNTLTLIGNTENGPFIGEQDILVIDNVAAGNK